MLLSSTSSTSFQLASSGSSNSSGTLHAPMRKRSVESMSQTTPASPINSKPGTHTSPRGRASGQRLLLRMDGIPLRTPLESDNEEEEVVEPADNDFLDRGPLEGCRRLA
eukprot:gnl/TRDRNA2_/TRDRNA2_162599_c1_seq1.p2 gnl/TRDRNA2_/TRDRNA2_162599_c1~~gnl/TRDRNA2_/TRDRNA2_162599_c1_seq1.p2  ORF type:complete len:109 (-),score=9.25 gnl/TRDRNA2_/TRDRNA2_162599_c1_seq1:111-437(-)